MEEEWDFCEVDLIGHCTFCRRKFVDRDDGLSSRKTEGGRRKGTDGGVPETVQVPPSLESFSHLWSYLVKDGGPVVGKFRFWRLSRLQEIPPMCQCCGKKIEELDKLHQMLMLKVEEIKRIVLESTLGGVFSWRNEELKEKMENSALEPFLKMSTFQFLNKLQESLMPLQSLYGHGDNAADSENLFDDWNAEREMLALATETDPLEIRDETVYERDGKVTNDDIKEEADSSASDPDDDVDDEDPVPIKFLSEGETFTINVDNQSSNQVSSPDISDAISSSEEDEDSSFNCDVQGTGESESDYDNLPSSEAGEDSSSHSRTKSFKRKPPHKNLKSNDTRRTEAKFKISPQTKGKRPRKLKLKPGIARASLPFKCDLCEEAYRTGKRLTSHKIKDHGAGANIASPLNCQYCNRACPNFYVLALHEKSHLEKGDFKCDHENCDKGYPNKHGLQRHIWSVHEQKGKRACPTCGKRFIGTSGLKKHVDSVHLKIKHQCPEPGCEARLADPYSLSMHLLTHQAPSHICPVCGKSLKTKHGFGNHLKSHSMDSRDKAPSAYRDKTKRTTKARKYKCKLPDCGKQFISMKDLLDHKKATNHDTEKKFVCDTCGKAFSTAHNLRTHNETIHLGLSIICEICGKRFGSTAGIYLHKRIHSGERPYECPMCKQKFRQRAHLSYHMRCHERLGEQFQLRGSSEHKKRKR